VIVSHDHRFIFLKTRKTAGTSIEIALSRFCGPRDIVTPITPEDEALRASLGSGGPRNFEGQAAKGAPGAKRRGVRFYNHMPAEEVRASVGDDVWRTYRKVTIERNPWDKAVSLYFWRQREEASLSLIEFLRAEEAGPHGRYGSRLSNWSIYTIDDVPAADQVMRYERLVQEIEALGASLGLPGAIELPHAKATSRPDRRPYQELMGPEERDIVARICRREIALLGYAF
jgi:hypothetical protein